MADQEPEQPALAVDPAIANEPFDDEEIAESSTASLRSSIMQYRVENGRTYHAYKDGKYIFPNDENESERLDLQHHVFDLCYDGKLGLCPLAENDASPGKVLDIGTGTGLWAIDFADAHPASEVIGVDLSPIQPSFIPPNTRFEVDDVEEPWAYSYKFDYIHSRMMTCCFADFEGFLKRCYENLEPGGYIELADIVLEYTSDDGTLLPSHASSKWCVFLKEAAKKRGRPFQDPRTYKATLESIGFVDVHAVPFKWTINPWPADKKMKEIGIWMLENLMAGLEAFSLALLSRELDWSREEIEVFLSDVRKCLISRSIHAYLPMWTVYGSKPSE
ncbi:S-adenosyl-L-methionine-dependent methyltransferase [Thozetella sp. PMI_491]|nr:S-adenosyl-L-methionine-dependent methyltransferase [Thozetella sp. PMI_491]